MFENEGNSVGIQPDIERIQHSAEHRHPIVGLEHFGCVRSHDRHTVARANAPARKRISQL